jgi:hypothetical protein
VLEGTAPNLDGPAFLGEGAEAAALRTRLLGPQGLGLLSGGFFKNPGRQATGGGHGEFFHLIQIDLRAGTCFAKALPNDDLTPVPGQFGDAT